MLYFLRVSVGGGGKQSMIQNSCCQLCETTLKACSQFHWESHKCVWWTNMKGEPIKGNIAGFSVEVAFWGGRWAVSGRAGQCMGCGTKKDACVSCSSSCRRTAVIHDNEPCHHGGNWTTLGRYICKFCSTVIQNTSKSNDFVKTNDKYSICFFC